MKVLDIVTDIYDFVGRPTRAALPLTIVLSKLYLVLGIVQKVIRISDRTEYLNKTEIQIQPNVNVYSLAGLPDFGTALDLTLVENANTPEEITLTIPRVTTIQAFDRIVRERGMAALISTNGITGLKELTLRPVPQLSGTMRLWWEKSNPNRPGLQESPELPDQWSDLIALMTARFCLPDIKGYDMEMIAKHESAIEKVLMPLTKVFDEWVEKDESEGGRNRRGFNELRRGRRGGIGGGVIDWNALQ